MLAAMPAKNVEAVGTAVDVYGQGLAERLARIEHLEPCQLRLARPAGEGPLCRSEGRRQLVRTGLIGLAQNLARCRVAADEALAGGGILDRAVNDEMLTLTLHREIPRPNFVQHGVC